MTVLNMANPAELEGRMAYDDGGHPVGVIEGVYLDNETRRPKWAAVRIDETGALVPLEGATPTPDGVQVMFAKERVLESPCRQPDLITELSHDTEELLYRYYGEARRRAESSSRPEGDGGDTLSAVKEEAAKLSDRAGEVTDVLKEKAGTVVEEAQTQAREVIHGARSQISIQAEAQVQQVARGLYQLAQQARALADGDRASAGPLADVVGRAGRELVTAAADIEARGARALASDYGKAVKRRPAPLAIGTTVALIAGAKLLKSPAGSRAKEAVVPRIKEGVAAAGRTVADELKPSAEQRLARVKEAAVGAADRLSGQAQGVSHDVGTQSKRSVKTVKRTARA